METETFELQGKDARDYFENDPENQDQLKKGDRVIVTLFHEKEAATWMVVPEGENPGNFVSEEDDYEGVVLFLVEHGFTSEDLVAVRRGQLETICHSCGHRWPYTGSAENATCTNCGRKTPTTPPTLLEYHLQNSLKVVTYGTGRSYVVVPKGDDLWGNLATVAKCATVDDWKPIDMGEYIGIPTYAYDRVVVSGLRCGL